VESEEITETKFVDIFEAMYGPIEFMLIEMASYFLYLAGVVIIVIALIKLRKKSNHKGVRIMIFTLIAYAFLALFYIVTDELLTDFQDTILLIVDSSLFLFGAVGFATFIKYLCVQSPNKVVNKDAPDNA
jgi:hypothetical protein